MARGLGSRLAQPMFTTCGKIQVKVPKYNNPKQLYGEAVMEEMISGTSVDPEKLDPESEAFKKRSTIPSFDPQQSSVLAVVQVSKLGWSLYWFLLMFRIKNVVALILGRSTSNRGGEFSFETAKINTNTTISLNVCRVQSLVKNVRKRGWTKTKVGVGDQNPQHIPSQTVDWNLSDMTGDSWTRSGWSEWLGWPK